MDIQQVIDEYHELLTDEMAEAADGELRHGLKARNLYFGDRPLCVVLRPHFYFEEHWEFMKKGLEGLLSAFARAHDVCMNNEEYRARLFLDPYEENLYSYDKSAPIPWSSSRLDTFYVLENKNLKCVEYNAETPAGIGYNDMLADTFDELTPMKKFRERYDLQPMRSLVELTDALLMAYHKWGGREKPQIAILDWSDVPTLNEHEITRVHFEKHGLQSILADPRSLDYRDGQLMYKDFRIDMIYKRVLYSELVERLGEENAVLRAYRDGNVFITNSPSAKLMAKKASLALLSDEANAHLFDKKQLESIHAHIPWTRVVEERKTIYDGKEVDLIDFIYANRDRLVIKPNDEYGGKGVVLGWKASEDGWHAAITTALETPYVVQEKVQLVQRAFPSWVDGELNLAERFVDADPYAFNGGMLYGCLTRLSPLALLNVTAGGGSVVPTYIIREK